MKQLRRIVPVQIQFGYIIKKNENSPIHEFDERNNISKERMDGGKENHVYAAVYFYFVCNVEIQVWLVLS